MYAIRYAVIIAIAFQIVGCGEGQEFDTAQNENDQTETPLNDQTGSNEDIDAPANPVVDIDIPSLRWSLVGIDVGGGVQEIEPTTPDPTWISNDFLSTTVLSLERTLAAKINCFSYQYELEITSPTTFRLGLSEPMGLDPECTPNAPEGVVEAVIGEYENIETGLDAENRLTVTNGNGTTLVFTALEAEE